MDETIEQLTRCYPKYVKYAQHENCTYKVCRNGQKLSLWRRGVVQLWDYGGGRTQAAHWADCQT